MADAAITGTVHLVGNTQSFGQKGFRKRELVLARDDGRWTDYVPINFIQDGCLDLDDIHPGDEVKVEVTLKGREWKKSPDDVRYFGENQAGRIKVLNAAKRQGTQTVDASNSQDFGEDDVPF